MGPSSSPLALLRRSRKGSGLQQIFRCESHNVRLGFIPMRVLVVEDERRMAELLKKGLEEENHRVVLAFDGRTGLELASSNEFDVLVLDLMLPGMDGYLVARRLRASHNQIPILMPTARDSVPDMARGMDCGANDYLTKPFSFVELLARLGAIAPRDGERRANAP